MESVYTSDTSNIKISDMSLADKECYLSELDDYLIEYRKSLNLNNNVSFGTEIEFEGVPKEQMDSIVDEFCGWKCVEEKDFVVGGEIVSPPLKDYITCWYDLRDMLNSIKEQKNVDVLHHAASHLHVNANSFYTYRNFTKFLLLYTIYEGIIYRFAYMDRLNARESLIYSASPMAIDLAHSYEDIENAYNTKLIKSMFDRFRGLNFTHIHSFRNYSERNTIEFRMGNGTLDPVLWQNMINFYTKLILASNKDLDMDRLNYLLQRIIDSDCFNYFNFDRYNLDMAIELADTIFDNMLDKTNFLKQYIKNGEKTVDSQTPCVCKKLTRG